MSASLRERTRSFRTGDYITPCVGLTTATMEQVDLPDRMGNPGELSGRRFPSTSAARRADGFLCRSPRLPSLSDFRFSPATGENRRLVPHLRRPLAARHSSTPEGTTPPPRRGTGLIFQITTPTDDRPFEAKSVVGRWCWFWHVGTGRRTQSLFPMQNRCFSPRMYNRPSATAGLERTVSPSGLRASNWNFVVAA